MAQLALACGAAKQAKNSKSAIFVFLQRAKIVIPNHPVSSRCVEQHRAKGQR